ncbi:hypothetical protein JVU11DRAFT_11871 [Chiua virens]|nr:hypothetical protein JVU11DRAFT_11871 [Chiua virens]
MSNSQDPSKMSGQFHSMKGSVLEGAGNATGNQSWSQSGKEEHARGEAEYKDSVVGAVTGDKSQQAAGNARNEKGQAQQEVNKPTTN